VCEDSVKIFTTSVNSNSKIFISPKISGVELPLISVKEVGEGYFIIKTDKVRTDEVSFDWWVVN